MQVWRVGHIEKVSEDLSPQFPGDHHKKFEYPELLEYTQAQLTVGTPELFGVRLRKKRFRPTTCG